MNQGKLKTVLRCGFAILFLLVLAKILTDGIRTPENQTAIKHTSEDQTVMEQPPQEPTGIKGKPNHLESIKQLETQSIRIIRELVQNPDTISFKSSEDRDHGTWQQVNMQFAIYNESGFRVTYWFVASNKQGFNWKLYDINRNLIDSGVSKD